MSEVVVVGNAGIDTNVYLYGADVDFTVEANFSQNLDYVGQAGGYTARGYAALGRSTAFIGHVGDDMGGRLIRETFARDGINSDALWIDPAGTQRSVNIMYRDGRRKNFYDGKGHMEQQPDLERCRLSLRGAQLAHFHLANWARMLLEPARTAGLRIAVDLQDTVSVDDPYRHDFISGADIIFCSAASRHNPGELLRALMARRPDAVIVIGMGAQGCGLGIAGEVRFFAPPPLNLSVIDTNGAGDALAVGFLVSYVLEQRTTEESLLRGQIAARHTCSLRASSDGLISAAQLTAYAASCAAPG